MEQRVKEAYELVEFVETCKKLSVIDEEREDLIHKILNSRWGLTTPALERIEAIAPTFFDDLSIESPELDRPHHSTRESVILIVRAVLFQASKYGKDFVLLPPLREPNGKAMVEIYYRGLHVRWVVSLPEYPWPLVNIRSFRRDPVSRALQIDRFYTITHALSWLDELIEEENRRARVEKT